MKIVKILTLLLSITVLCGCANNPFYHSIVVHPQIKEMVDNLLTKKITLYDWLVNNEEYYAKKNNIQNMHYAQSTDFGNFQSIINRLTPKEITKIKYRYTNYGSNKENSMCICKIEYVLDNKSNYFELIFGKSDDEMEYHFITLDYEGNNELQ